MFCFPYAGGGATIYRAWSKELPEWVDVCPVQLPGREARIRESAYTRIDPLIEAAYQALLPYFDRPFCFFGHSMGALVSYEITRHVRRNHNLQPALLLVSGSGAPHLPNRSTLKHDLSEDKLLHELAKLDATPKEVLASTELMQLVLPILRADLELCDVYEHAKERPLACSIIAYGGTEDPWATRNDLQAWGEHTIADFDLRMLAGGHFFIESARRTFLGRVTRDLSLFERTTDF
jgi:medium-chain acyl-[acyl-carrier-protein] hydrolase